jgi:hypothetical protein
LAQLVKLTIRDACQDKDARLREEAARWLWWWSPAIARRAELPQVDTIPIDNLDYILLNPLQF